VWPKKGFNGDGAVVSYLNDKGDNHGPYGNYFCSVRAVQRVGICPHSHEPRASTDPIHAAASVVLHQNQGSAVIVRCIDNRFQTDILVGGRQYEVLGERDDCYILSGFDKGFSKTRFEIELSRRSSSFRPRSA
jgi:hypothetical protein